MNEPVTLQEHYNTRKALFNKILEPSSHMLLRDLGVTGGAHIVDVGCGEGSLALQMCKWVGPSGRVTAIDLDEKKLQLLDKKAKVAGFSNLILLHGDAYTTLQTVKNADMLYARFFLMHVANPIAILTLMSKCLKLHGRIVLEEPVLSATNDFPETGFWQSAMIEYKRLCVISGTNPDYGCSLPRHAQLAGLNILTANQIQPIISPALAQEYLEYAICSHREDYLTFGVLSETEYNALLDSIRQHPLEKIHYCGFHGVMQIVCNKHSTSLTKK
jgi:precorrin-6B methylase 2